MDSTTKVEHLVVDANALIRGFSFWQNSLHVYTVDGVKKEIKDQATRERLRNSPHVLEFREPTSESVAKIIHVAKKTGDYPVLSLIDINLMALTLDLQQTHVGLNSVKFDVRSVLELIEESEQTREEKDSETLPAGFVTADSDDDADWLDSDVVLSLTETGCSDVKVACMTSDFAMQNVLLHMQLSLVDVDGRRIKKLRTYLLRCRSCYRLVHDMEKEFCPKCGNKNLHRVSVTVDPDGITKVHLDPEKLSVKRGMYRTQRNIKGGKHDHCDRFFEDQRMPQNRLARVHQVGHQLNNTSETQNAVSDSPFAMHDVTSRSAILGIKSHMNAHGDDHYFSHPKGRKGGRRN